MFTELFCFKSLFPSLYKVAMVAIVLLIGFFVVDAAIEMALMPRQAPAKPAPQHLGAGR